MNSLTLTLLEETKTAFSQLRGSTLEAMQKLYQVKTSGIWEEVASSWGEYVESELGISQGFASKLLTVNDHYLLKAGFSQDKLAEIDYEKLYLAIKTDGTPEEQLARAKTLSRSELRQEREETKDHAHEYIEICKHCGQRKS